MPAYVIAQLAVTDPAGFEAYRKAAGPVVKACAGRNSRSCSPMRKSTPRPISIKS